MKFRLGLLLLGAALALQAQTQQMNVDQLAQFIRSELALKQHTDKQVAAYIKATIQLTEKLTDKTIIDLEAQGAGPRTVEALQALRDKTATLKAPTHDVTSSPASAPDTTLTSAEPTASLSAKPQPIPPPNSIRQHAILDQVRQYALSYTQNLPNFVCVEVMRRYVDPRGTDSFRSIGNILTKVSYNEGQEEYKVYSVNGHYQDTTIEKAAAGGGAISTGEFGSLMREIFESRSQAEFNWDHWGTLRGRRMAVFNYFIDSGHSAFSISYSSGPGDDQRIVTAYKGLIYADENTGEIARITFVAVDIPKSFPVREAVDILDYDDIEISGQHYICPLRALLTMSAEGQRTKNEIEFRDYRKFGTDTNIVYGADDVPPPLPASKIDEEPATSPTSQNTRSSSQKTPAPSQTNSNSSPWTLPVPPPPPPQ